MTKDEISIFINDRAAIYPGDAEFMYDTISKLPDVGNLLEIGTGYGHSAVFFSQLKPGWTIYTVDGYGEYGTVPQFFKHKEFSAQGFIDTKSYLNSRGLLNIVQIVGNSNTLEWNYPVDVVFLDGDHTLHGLTDDFEHYSPFAKVIFIHDYDFKGMEGNEVMEFLDTIKDDWKIEGFCHTAKVTRKDKNG